MWGPVYIEEKLREFAAEELARRARLELAAEPVETHRRRIVARIGRMLVRLGTLLQDWAQARALPSEAAALAGAEE